MTKENFDVLLRKVSPSLYHRRYCNKLRAEISSSERLALTLRYFASGDSQVSLSYGFRLGKSTVCSILKETCDVIWDVLGKEFVKAPTSVDERKSISRDFYMKLNFRNCIGCMTAVEYYIYHCKSERCHFIPKSSNESQEIVYWDNVQRSNSGRLLVRKNGRLRNTARNVGFLDLPETSWLNKSSKTSELF
ncbi:hypothetical protein EMCRGX_G004602 [Ephydatia muelleri]